MSKIHVNTTVNGDEVDFLCDPRETLLDCLRDKLQL
ncbi:MAG: (2Fe-2S)-binding protein, partial [Paracoccaceae bacterium]